MLCSCHCQPLAHCSDMCMYILYLQIECFSYEAQLGLLCNVTSNYVTFKPVLPNMGHACMHPIQHMHVVLCTPSVHLLHSRLISSHRVLF